MKDFTNCQKFKFILYNLPGNFNKRIGILSSSDIGIVTVKKIIPKSTISG